MSLRVRSDLVELLIAGLYKYTSLDRVDITSYALDWCTLQLSSHLDWIDIYQWLDINKFGHGIELDKKNNEQLEDLIIILN